MSVQHVFGWVAVAVAGNAAASSVDSMTADELFSTAVVHEIAIELPWAAWYDSLAARKEDGSYVPGLVQIDGVSVDSCGVRFKGNSSYNGPGYKKPFRLKFDAFVEDQAFAGVDGISLGNGSHDPTFMREALTYEIHRGTVLASRTGYANITVNGELMGLYVVVEPVNQTWTRNHIARSENGNLWKGDPHGDLTWKGPDLDRYRNAYTLETNEADDDWSALIEFIDVLNNTPLEARVAAYDTVLDAEGFLANHALHMAAVNLDSYSGSGHNYYIYHRDDEDRFVHIPWDLNESFGRFRDENEWSELAELDPFWESSRSRPLVTQLLEVPTFRRMYLLHLRRLVETRWSRAWMDPRIDSLDALLEPHVEADPHKFYSLDEFRRNQDEDLNHGQSIIFGLRSFVDTRGEVLRGTYEPELGSNSIFLNELCADNRSLATDEAGEAEDYVELYRPRESSRFLEGWGLTDDLTDPFQWTLPAEVVVPGKGHLVLWLDGDIEQGALHSPFSLDADGEGLYLFKPDGTLADFLVFGAQGPDAAWGRRGDGSEWIGSVLPTPEAANVENAPPVVVNVVQSAAFPGPAEALTFVATVRDDDHGDDELSVQLIYDVGDGDRSVSLEPTVGGVWRGEISSEPPGTDVAFYLEVTDADDGSAVRPWTAPDTRWSARFTVGISGVMLNEAMADNETTLQDEAGDFDDWIELVNWSTGEVDLSGFHLSDDATEPDQWEFPEGTVIAAGERIIVWTDDDEGDGPLHTNFKLSAGGEFLGLFGPERTGYGVLDSVSFGAQESDHSLIRTPDGLGVWAATATPSPEGSNGGGFVALAVPEQDPVVIPSEGGAFGLQATVFNRNTTSEEVEAWTVADLGAREVPLVGPISLTLAAESHVSTGLRQAVPGSLGPITAQYQLRLGEWPSGVDAVSGFTVVKEP